MPYQKIYGLEHFAVYILKKIKRNKKVYENDVVWLIHGLQLALIVAAIDLLFFGIL